MRLRSRSIALSRHCAHLDDHPRARPSVAARAGARTSIR